MRTMLLAGACLPAMLMPSAAQQATELQRLEVEGSFGDGTGPFEGYVPDASASSTKGAVPLIETPQAVTVIGAEQISDQAARTVVEATRYAPGIRSETFGNDLRNDWFLIRGFSSQVSSYYLDGLPLPSSGTFATWKMNPFLLERIDILRGPSSSLYGSSNPGGLINMISKRPTGSEAGEITVGIDEHGNGYSALDAQGVAGEGNEWAWRFAATGNAGETGFSFTEDDQFAIMPTLTWTPNADTTIDVYASLQQFNTNTQNFLPYLGTAVDAPFGRIDPELFTSEPSSDKFQRFQAMAGYEAEHHFNEDVTVRQNLRYAHLEVDFRGVYGLGYAAPPTATSAELARGNFLTTPELGLFTVDNQVEWKVDTGLLAHTWLFGLDYKRFDLRDEAGFESGPSLDLLDPTYVGVAPPLSRYDQTSTVQNQVGLYAQDFIEIGNWNVVLSGRYDNVDTEITDRPTGTVTDQSSDAFSGRAGLIYNFDNGISPYVSVSRSFLPVVGTDSVTGQPFDPETGTQYEAGVKYQPAGWGDSHIALSVFDLTRENFVTSDGINFNRQIGEVRSRGFEIEAQAEITPDLSLIGAYTWYDLQVEEGNPVEVGMVTPATPEQFGSLWLDYTVPAGAFEGVSLGGGVRYVGSSYADTANTLKVDDVFLVDAAIRYEKDSFAAALNVSNLFDETYVAGCSSPVACFYGEGREVELTLSYKW